VRLMSALTPGRARQTALAAGGTLALAAGAIAGGGSAAAWAAAVQSPAARPVPAMRSACAAVGPRQARCYALFARQASVNAAIAAGQTGPAAAPKGWGATDIEAAYKLPVSANPHQTVAVVEAYSTPHLAADLGVYRHQYSLPACTVASGCLRIVNQKGQTSPLPASGVPYGWDVETLLDVSMVSAACPQCSILVVQANNQNFSALAAAEDTAARLGADVISNSYGGRETGFSQTYAAAYHHPGHTIVASSGDTGFGAANFPANLATVTAAGGTQLAKASNARGWTEKVWNAGGDASGSGCSAYVAKPAWQHDPHCPGRTVADVSAVAWNVPMYDQNEGGWLTVGGTSVAAPLIAGVYALAGNATTVRPGSEYAHAGALFDVTVGNNGWPVPGGAACGNDYLCTAKKGYDAPTGLGTPDGTSAF
jgi:subtilase family serine protease